MKWREVRRRTPSQRAMTLAGLMVLSHVLTKLVAAGDVPGRGAEPIANFHARLVEEWNAKWQALPSLRLDLSDFDRELSNAEVVRRVYGLVAPPSPLDTDPEHPTLIETLDRWEELRVRGEEACDDDPTCLDFYRARDPRRGQVLIGNLGVFRVVRLRVVRVVTAAGDELGRQLLVRAHVDTPNGLFEIEVFRAQAHVELRANGANRYYYDQSPFVRGRRVGDDDDDDWRSVRGGPTLAIGR